MKFRVVGLGLVILMFVAGALTLYAWSARPQLSETSPQPGAVVPSTTTVRLSFSRPMDHASVIERLDVEPAMAGMYSWDRNSLIFTPSQPWPGGQEIILHLAAGGRAASWLAFPLGELSFRFITSKTELAYLWPSTGKADLYSLDPATGSIHRYTYGSDVRDFTASKDGKILYFSAVNGLGGTDIYRYDRIDANNSAGQPYQPEKLLDCGIAQCANPAVSMDGLTLAYEKLDPSSAGGSGSVQVWTMSLINRTSSSIGLPGHETVQPAWSASGWLAFYDRTSSNYEVYNPATNDRVQLPNQTGQPGAWSLDGAYFLAPEITYNQAGGSQETGNSHLLRYRLQDKTFEDISGLGMVEDVGAVYSPDGGSIAFARKFLDAAHWSPGRQIWIMGSDGSNSHPITDEASYNHYDLAWSQDGRQLAYVRFNQEKISDPPELWMVNTDGSNPVQLVIGGYSPIWMP